VRANEGNIPGYDAKAKRAITTGAWPKQINRKKGATVQLWEIMVSQTRKRFLKR
jgi:hypothetical protein